MIPHGLAPMEGVTGFPMRLWLHWASQPASMTTPFLRVTRGQPEGGLPLGFAPELVTLRGVLPYELYPQYITSDPDSFLRACDLLPPACAAFIEVNFGCPSPTSLGKSAGSGILKDPDEFGLAVAKLAGALGPERLAVKMRLGFESDAEFAALLGHVAPQALAKLTVHGRTRKDGYRGRARWDVIETGAHGARAPTWASGDVLSAKSLALLHAAAPSIAGVIVGRGAIRNPWIFEELRTGAAVAIDLDTLLNALLAFALVNELWITAPERFIARVGKGRWSQGCGTRFEAWEKVVVDLTTLVYGAPFVLSKARAATDVKLAPTTLARVKFLWGHLRTSLPAAYFAPRLMRAKSLAELFAGIAAAAEVDDEANEAVTLRHRSEWDYLFS